MSDRDHGGRRRAGFIVSVSVLLAFLARRFVITRKRPSPGPPRPGSAQSSRRPAKVTAATIAEELLHEGLEGEALFDAMWAWHDRTGIETRDIFDRYKTLRHNPPPTVAE